MNKLIYILFTIILTLLSVVMVFLNFRQNRSLNADKTYVVSPTNSLSQSKAVSFRNKKGGVEYPSFNPRSGSPAPKVNPSSRVAFDYTVVSIDKSQVQSSSGYSGKQSYIRNYSRAVPESSRSSVSLPAYSGAGSRSNPSAYKVQNSLYAGNSHVQPFSRQTSNFQNVGSSSSETSQDGIFSSGLLASSGQTRQGANSASMADPLAVDPGGDPEDPGEMIPVPDGMLVMLMFVLLYILYISVFVRKKI